MRPFLYSKENLRRLAERHIAKFANLIKVSEDPDHPRHKNVNRKECEMYLEIWKGIQAKDCDWDRLGLMERNEVSDAVADAQQP